MEAVSHIDFDINIIKLLIEADANVDIQNNNGDTALVWAVVKHNIEIIKLLLEAGANVNLQYNKGETVLMIAVNMNHNFNTPNFNIDIIKLLLDARAEIDSIRNDEGKTVEQIAIEKGNQEIIVLIEEAKQSYILKGGKRKRQTHKMKMLFNKKYTKKRHYKKKISCRKKPYKKKSHKRRLR
jgi:ankyrin repeat protein